MRNLLSFGRASRPGHEIHFQIAESNKLYIIAAQHVPPASILIQLNHVFQTTQTLEDPVRNVIEYLE